jgi:hypothetical protein
VAARANDIELARAVHSSIRLNGRSVLDVSAKVFHHPTDEGFGAIIADLRALPMQPQPKFDSTSLSLVRLSLVLNRFDQPAETIRDEIQQTTKPVPSDLQQLGGYLWC